MRSLASFAFALCLVACGGNAAKPASPAAPSSSSSVASGDAGAETFGEVNAADVAELQGGAKAAPPAPASAPGPASEPVDECSPVGRDFEKRARPKIKECYREGKKKEPDLKGTIKITLEVDGLGKLRAPRIQETTLPKGVAACMLKAVKDTPMPEAAKCPNKTVSLPVTFPTPP